MTIIEITNHRELPLHTVFHCYVACCNAEEAAEMHLAKYGKLPTTAYIKRDKSGKCSVYMQVEE